VTPTPVLEIRVPQLGEGLREVRIVELLRRAGESVRRGDPLYVVETDKSTVELEAPVDGALAEWTVAPGDVVAIGGIVARLAGAEGATPAAQHRLVPPRTRAYAREKGLTAEELAAIPSASTKVMPADVDAYLAKRAEKEDASAAYVEQPLGPVQRALVYRLRRSAEVAIPGTVGIELPGAWLAGPAGTAGPKPTAFQVFGHAVAHVAARHPRFRSVMIGDDRLREYAEANVGIAVARPGDELIAVVIRGADRMSLPEFARAFTHRMRSALREGDQAAGDVQILLTYLGDFGIVDAVPTLVAPAGSVFFLGAPQAGSGMVRVVLTFDHRLVNGAAASAFLADLREFLRPK
jgi:pyruvate/2-oxoglutarate dehydrogenase complex dihydrolipoamide acyltransferase (E2) component